MHFATGFFVVVVVVVVVVVAKMNAHNVGYNKTQGNIFSSKILKRI